MNTGVEIYLQSLDIMVFEVPLSPDTLGTGVFILTGAHSVIIRDCGRLGLGEGCRGTRLTRGLIAYWNFVSLPSSVEEGVNQRRNWEHSGGEGRGQRRDSEDDLDGKYLGGEEGPQTQASQH